MLATGAHSSSGQNSNPMAVIFQTLTEHSAFSRTSSVYINRADIGHDSCMRAIDPFLSIQVALRDRGGIGFFSFHLLCVTKFNVNHLFTVCACKPECDGNTGCALQRSRPYTAVSVHQAVIVLSDCAVLFLRS